MTDEELREYRTNSKVMFDAIESCLEFLLRSRRNITIARTGDSDTGKKVQVGLTNSIDIESYKEDINFRKDVLRYLKKMKKYFQFDDGYSVREVFILDVGFGLTWYEFNYSKSPIY